MTENEEKTKKRHADLGFKVGVGTAVVAGVGALVGAATHDILKQKTAESRPEFDPSKPAQIQEHIHTAEHSETSVVLVYRTPIEVTSDVPERFEWVLTQTDAVSEDGHHGEATGKFRVDRADYKKYQDGDLVVIKEILAAEEDQSKVKAAGKIIDLSEGVSSAKEYSELKESFAAKHAG